jgi:Ca2+-binding RTX toxin-like protein
MRRASLLLAVMALALVAASGLALADNIQGDGGNNRLVGTNGKDTISGSGGHDDVFGKGAEDRLYGDSGNDEVSGGGRGDRLQGGLGQDKLFGQGGNDFANAIDGQANDSINCGRGSKDVAGVDFLNFGARVDNFAQNCERVYVGVGPFPVRGASSDSGIDLSSIDTAEEAEAAEADGLLKQIR